MKTRIATILIASTAMMPAAFAQDNQQQNQQATAADCQRLTDYVNQNETDETGINADRAEQIAESGDLQACNDALRMARGEISVNEGSENFDEEALARVRVLVSDPQVMVEQSSPNVQVKQPQPDVAVNTGPPQVTVNQAQPQVQVQMTPPKITIDMPKPQILVEMPDPTVDVSMPEPRVTVSQDEPTVRVEQGEVQMSMGKQDIEGEQPADQQGKEAADSGANVDVEQSKAVVNIEDADPADVEISESKPQVTYNSAEPNIQVDQGGEPQVSFNQSGEANVQIRQMSAEETRQASAQQNSDRMRDQQDQSQQASAGRDADRMQDRQDQNQQASAGQNNDQKQDQQGQDQQASAEQTPDEETTASVNASNDGQVSVVGQNNTSGPGNASQILTADQIRDLSVRGANGDTIGDVEEVFVRDKIAYVVVGNGGFLGLGEKQIALPISDMTFRQNTLVMRDVTEDEAEDMQEFSEGDFQTVSGDQQIEINQQ